MDWADDIAYSVHDFEDAIHAGHLPLMRLHDSERTQGAARPHPDRYAPAV